MSTLTLLVHMYFACVLYRLKAQFERVTFVDFVVPDCDSIN